MKTLKTFLAMTALLAIVGAASAQTKIYITGSTAFRSATVNAITTTVGVAPTAWDGNTSGVTSANNANAVTWTGGNVGGNAVTIKASWSGSGAGIQTVAGAPAFNVRFLADVGTGGVVAGSGNNDPRPSSSTNAEAHVPDVAMSDIFQGGTPFNGTVNSVAYQHLVDTTVGVVTFKWVGSTNFPATNMTPQIAQFLYPNSGVAPLSLWTGNSGDNNIGVYAGGRDPDSGTRATTFAESGIGIFTNVFQWQPTVSGTTITALQYYPATTINGIALPDGDSGESSGSSLRGFTTKTLTQTAYQAFSNFSNGYMVAYLGVGDANSVTPPNGTAVPLTWNGVAFSQAAVENGSYTFWGYEHLDKRSGIAGDAATFATNLANNILATTSATLNPNVKLSDMAVSRASDGGIVQPNGF